MKRAALLTAAIGLAIAAFWFQRSPAQEAAEEMIWHHRNLGKAFYENPTTQLQAVEEFQKALALVPDSPREQVNYGLALLRAGKTQEGIEALQKAQQQDPSIPHTWFNLGIAFKKESRYEEAGAQFEQMVRLAPDEPVSHYNMGYLYKLAGRADAAVEQFEAAARLDPNLAGPHFQLYNSYRQEGRTDDAARELKLFQEIKARQAGAAIPEDLDWSYYAEIYETIEPLGVPGEESGPELQFEDTRVATDFDPATAGLTVLDADGDTRPDLIAWSSGGARLFRNGSEPVEGDAGLGGLRNVISIVPGDFDNDGLADLCVITNAGALLYHNEQGTFQSAAAQLPAGRYAAAVWMDFDHDYDLDLFLLGENSALARNNGTAGFSNVTANFPFVAGAATHGVLFEQVADTNGTDLAVVYAGRSGVIYRDRLAGKFESEPVTALPAGATQVAAEDVNNDSWMDIVASEPSGVTLLLNRGGELEAAPSPQTSPWPLVLVGTENNKGQLQAVPSPQASAEPLVFADFENRGFGDLVAGGSIYRNRGLGRFASSTTATEHMAAHAVAAADFNQDGKADLAAILADGTFRLFSNQTATQNSWLQVYLTGVKNLALAPGAEVELKAGPDYRKQVYTGVPLLFGIPSGATVDTLRITWPNGLIQNETQPEANQSASYKEAQRLSGSCPMIFTWNGEEFEFITDVLGVAPLGASAGDGEYFPVDHDEYIQIPGESLALEEGRFEIRITEELREVAYLDQIELIAVDHPARTEIFTNDKFKAPPFPEFRLFGIDRRVYPVAARDSQGNDVLPKLLRKDAAYPDGFRRDYSGVAELHHLDLDFGGAAPDNRAVLVLRGWLDWADGSTYLGVSQQDPAGLILPYIQVKDAAGRWETVVEDMGVPAGKPKTIVVDLTGKFLSASREVRIVTNLCLYWDEIFLSENTADPAVVLTRLSPESADLRFRGFSRPVIHPERKQPESFDYQQWMPLSMWNPTPGNYTRYGEVKSLLRSADDQMVIMGSGDELRLLFPAQGLPSLPQGWRRDFLLLVDGWAKDQDANTAFSQTVEPLPFHGMSVYPYPPGERFPNDEAHQAYQQQSNTRPALRLVRPLAETARRAVGTQ